MRNKSWLVFIILISLLVITSFVCVLFGGSKVSLSEIWNTIFYPQTVDVSLQTIIWQIRIPRVILSLFIGAGLAVAGCVFQGILRNPLADTYTLGISGGAALGTTLGTILGFSGVLKDITLPGFAFLGALVSIFFVYFVASRKRFSVSTMILGGVILSFLFSSIVLLIFALVRSEQVQTILIWLMGDLSSTNIGLTRVIVVSIILGILWLAIWARELDLLTLGDEKATHLGVNTETVKKMLFVVASLITGVCVSGSGMIGFVGLIIPHFVRRIVGPAHRFVIPASAFSGAIYLALCDTLARSLIAPVELPVGVITGLFGGIFFLSFLLGTKKWQIF